MRIRLATPDDGPRLAEIYRPAVVNSTLSVEPLPPDGAAMAHRIRDTLPHRPWLVAADQTLLGYAYASSHRVRASYAWSVEVSIYTDPAVHRRGIGRALYASLLAILRLQGFQNAYAGLTVPNPPSRALHLAFGFKLLGTYPKVAFKDGRWLDLEWFGLALGSYPSFPLPPRPLPELVGTPAFAAALATGLQDRGVAAKP
ncbi:MAG TPA: GNAT family N-acetyltransferase [Gemmatimonadales bacterium]|nr:GNAT family N-acetyltransferase [Gemmatimonadales bacterium]